MDQTRAKPAVVTHLGDGRWQLQPADGGPVHLVALFRDPGIEDGRSVAVVLDLHEVDGLLRAGKACWVAEMVEALRSLPPDISVALHNGVDIRCPRSDGADRYTTLLKAQFPERLAWMRRHRRPDGGQPGVVICDRDLAVGLAAFGTLQKPSGEPWTEPKRFVDAVGAEIIVDGINGMILAHPVVLRRHPAEYVPAVQSAVPGIVRLAGL